eukprot:279226_1
MPTKRFKTIPNQREQHLVFGYCKYHEQKYDIIIHATIAKICLEFKASTNICANTICNHLEKQFNLQSLTRINNYKDMFISQCRLIELLRKTMVVVTKDFMLWDMKEILNILTGALYNKEHFLLA